MEGLSGVSGVAESIGECSRQTEGQRQRIGFYQLGEFSRGWSTEGVCFGGREGRNVSSFPERVGRHLGVVLSWGDIIRVGFQKKDSACSTDRLRRREQDWRLAPS